MSHLSVAFIRSSMIYLLVGITLGAIMAFPGGFALLSAMGRGNPTIAHAHVQLLGFLVMMVAGVAYHIFPRFTGNPLLHPNVAWAHFWFSQIGTAGMVLGFLFRGPTPWLLPVAAVVNVAGLCCFCYNMLQVVRPLQRLSNIS